MRTIYYLMINFFGECLLRLLIPWSLLSCTRTCDFSYRRGNIKRLFVYSIQLFVTLLSKRFFTNEKKFKEISYLCLKCEKHVFAQVIC